MPPNRAHSPLELHAAVHGTTELKLDETHAAMSPRGPGELIRVHSQYAAQLACGYLNRVRT
jgi:hypothetical protein